MYAREHKYKVNKNSIVVTIDLMAQNQAGNIVDFDVSQCEKFNLTYSSPSFTGERILTTKKDSGSYYQVLTSHSIKVVLYNLDHNSVYLIKGTAFYGTYTLSLCNISIEVPSGITNGVQNLGTITQIVVKSFEINSGGGGTDDYEALLHKPMINGNILMGNKSADELGLIGRETFLNTLYPQGTILATWTKVSPATYIGGVWELIDEGYYPVATVKDIIDEQNERFKQAGLPNITGKIDNLYLKGDRRTVTKTGALSKSTIENNEWGKTQGGDSTNLKKIEFDASGSNSIYGASDTVQPKSVKFYLWRRTDTGQLAFNFKNITFSDNDFIVDNDGKVHLKNTIYSYLANKLIYADANGVLASSNIDVSTIAQMQSDIEDLKQGVGAYVGYFNTKADLLAYSGVLTDKATAVVGSDETHSGECWKYMYNAITTTWNDLYMINESPLTQTQLDAINSGINATKVAQIATNTEALANVYTKTATNALLDNKLNKQTTGNTLKVYSHLGSSQGDMDVLTAISQSPLDTQLLSERAVYDALQTKVPVKTGSGAELYAHIGNAQTAIPRVTTINELATDNQIPSAASVFNLVHASNLVAYDVTKTYQDGMNDIFTQLNVPANGCKIGYVVNFTPAITAGASQLEGYIIAYNRNDNTKLLEFIPYRNTDFTYEKWCAFKVAGSWKDITSVNKYMHTLIRYNNDSLEYPMGWCVIINHNPTMTFADFKTWLSDNGYTTDVNSYWYAGGCCGTTGVRNKEDTGTSYVGRVVSGIYLDTSSDTMYFKYDYNGTVSLPENRCKIQTVKL